MLSALLSSNMGELNRLFGIGSKRIPVKFIYRTVQGWPYMPTQLS